MSMELHRCFRCGWCKLPSDFVDYNCPSYAKFRFESFSPGGRLWLIRAWLNRELTWSENFAKILFSCVACKNCAEQCKMRFKDEIVDWITSAKSLAIEKGLAPPKVRDFLENIAKHGNPWGLPRAQRASWLDLNKFEGEGDLLYIGCECAYEERGQKMAKNVIELFKIAGLSFGTLGNEEECDGNEAYMLGELGLFQELASKNTQKFKELGVKKVITISPHAFNAMKKYPDRDFEVLHFTQLLLELIQKGKLRLSELDLTVTYHDPCFLGRHNGIYSEPRKILKSIPGLKLVEMKRNKENSFCCGGGSGNFVFDLLGGSESPARLRVREALNTGAEILAVACPICKAMFEDAVKDEGSDLEVKDIAEILLRSAERI
ncbi:MAG: (Fe-S)-binding protein [Archaeoglobales archaeon]|nr:(Fe-S)-binding protein [Archaeoglobales archaeon]